MFGLKKMRGDLDFILTNMVCHEIFESFNIEIKKQFKANEMESKKIDHLLIDLKTALSSTKIKLSEICEKISPYKDCVDNLLVYTQSVEILCDKIKDNSSVIIEMQKSINQMLLHQHKMIDFMETQDKINQDLIAVIETYGPVKKIPKLPKKKQATIDHS